MTDMIDIVRFTGEKFDLGFKEVFHISQFNTQEGGSIEKNKELLTNRNLDILINVESHPKKDSLHFRNSGLNQALCKLANKNEIAIGFNFNLLLNAAPVHRHTLIGRMMQNVRLCRKAKVKMIVASFANNKWEMRHAKDLLAFARTIGMDGGEAKEALNFKKKEKKIKLLQNTENA